MSKNDQQMALEPKPWDASDVRAVLGGYGPRFVDYCGRLDADAIARVRRIAVALLDECDAAEAKR